MPPALQSRLASSQRPGIPLLGPAAATAGGGENLIEAGPLYAGECVARVNDIRPAGEIVRDLTP